MLGFGLAAILVEGVLGFGLAVMQVGSVLDFGLAVMCVSVLDCRPAGAMGLWLKVEGLVGSA